MTTRSVSDGWRVQTASPQAGGIGGFTYLSLLIIIAIMAITLGAAGEFWYITLKREKEQELLFVGDQFRRAIESFYQHTPGQGRRYPLHLEDLLIDPRYPSTKRYLRKIYADPVSGSTGWGLVKGPDGEIYGVYSLSAEEPIKKRNFGPVDKNFEDREKYMDWVFMHTPGE